jgi:hypothetical protein
MTDPFILFTFLSIMGSCLDPLPQQKRPYNYYNNQERSATNSNNVYDDPGTYDYTSPTYAYDNSIPYEPENNHDSHHPHDNNHCDNGPNHDHGGHDNGEHDHGGHDNGGECHDGGDAGCGGHDGGGEGGCGGGGCGGGAD